MLVSEKHKSIAVPLSAKLVNLFPHARVVTLAAGHMVVLPHRAAETRVLRNLGYEAPAPVLSQYDWCGGSPFHVQKQTAAMLTTNQRAYVLNNFGTGKTKSALWSYDFLRREGAVRRALVVAPLSTLFFTWAREVFDTVPHLDCVVVHGTREKRYQKMREDHDIYIVNPHGLEIIEPLVRERGDIDVFVIDELATFRNGRSKKLHDPCRRIAEVTPWVWGMTGSPTPNDPSDAWGQARIVTPATVPARFTWFRDEVLTKVGPFQYVPKRDAADRVFRALQPAVRYTLDDVVELPDVIERQVDVDLGAKQKHIYETLRQHAHAMIKNEEITAANAGAVLNKLLQVSMGYVYTSTRKVASLDNTDRLDALIDAVNSCDQKVLVFAPYTHAIDGICERFDKEKISYGRIDGSTTQKARGNIFNAFQRTSKFKAIIAHPGTMAHGVTLTSASMIVWFGPVTSLEIFEQANARIRRIGQKHKQLIIMLQSTAAERRIYKLLRNKQKVQDEILDLFAKNT